MRWWLLRFLVCSSLFSCGMRAADKWTELNIGPYYVDTDTDIASARFDLTQLEQVRWVMSGLLEIKDLNTTWPVRVLVTNSSKPSTHFRLHNGFYILVIAPNSRLPLGEVARLFLEAHTPILPADVENGVAELFDTLQANGSRVTWGGTPPHASLAFARLQLFATKFEYSASFHIFMNSLRSGSTLRAAERNAFNKDPEALEQEASARLAANSWQAVSVSGRPLDPRRDFGDHSIEASVARAYAASTLISTDPAAAESILKQCLNEGGATTALALDSLAEVARARGEKPEQFFNDAIQAGSKNAAVYVGAADNLAPDHALPLLKKAELLNPLWSEPIYQEAEATEDLTQREALLKRAIQVNPRATDYWVALARTQMANGHALAAQSSWVRAEDSAPDEAKRKFVQHLHDSLENERLEEASAERKRERDDAVLADQRAQQAEADRIRASEERANKASAAQAGSSSDTDVVDWNSLTKTQKAYGSVVMVDCRGDYTRVAVRDLRGKTRQLLYHDPDNKTFNCENRPKSGRLWSRSDPMLMMFTVPTAILFPSHGVECPAAASKSHRLTRPGRNRGRIVSRSQLDRR